MSELTEIAQGSSLSTQRLPRRRAIKWRQTWILIAVFVAAALVRIGLINRSGLWGDEVFSLAVATGHSLEHPAAAAHPELGDFVEPDHPVPAQEFSQYVRHQSPLESPARIVRAVTISDTSPPLYYLLLYGWTLVLGTSDFALRLFSTACALACLPILVAIARRTGGKAAVLPACLLFAASPIAIYYSIEGRMYTLLWLCVLATCWASLAMREGRARTGPYAVWVLASAAGFLTHYFFIFPWFAIVAFLMVQPGKLSRVHLLICIAATAVVIFPWYVQLPESLARWRITKDWQKMRPVGFDPLTSFFHMVATFFVAHDKRLWFTDRWRNVLPLLIFGGIATLMVWKMRWRILARGRLLLFLIFVAACAGPCLFDYLLHTYTIFWPRYAVSGLPAAYLLTASGLACLRRRASLIVLVLLVLSWIPNLFALNSTRFGWAPMREIARAATNGSRASDLILVHSIPSGVITIARYAKGPAPIASWIPQLGNRRSPESIESLAKGRTGIVFVKVHEVGTPAPEADWLRANAIVARETQVGLVKVADFRPINSATF